MSQTLIFVGNFGDDSLCKYEGHNSSHISNSLSGADKYCTSKHTSKGSHAKLFSHTAQDAASIEWATLAWFGVCVKANYNPRNATISPTSLNLQRLDNRKTGKSVLILIYGLSSLTHSSPPEPKPPPEPPPLH